jgi:fluoride exporter
MREPRSRPRSRLHPGSVAAVGIGGGFGALARYEVGLRFAAPTPPHFPATTLAINVAGAFALGALMTLILDVWPPTRYMRPFAAIGVLGGFTTFSTFSVDVVRLAQSGHAGAAIAYVAASALGGMIAVFAGARAARTGRA